MAGRLRGGATGASAASSAASHPDAPSTSKNSSFFSSLGLKGRDGRPLKQVIADLAAAQEEDDGYDSESGSESDSESGEERGGWRTRSSSKAEKNANAAGESESANFNSSEPKGFEPDLGIRVIKGDGKCMFRALARGMARNKGVVLSPGDETRDADTLRLAVRDALCRSDERRRAFQEAVTSVEVAEGDRGVLDAPALEHLGEQPVGAAVGVVGHDHVAARPEHRAQQAVLGGEPARERQPGAAALERRLGGMATPDQVGAGVDAVAFGLAGSQRRSGVNDQGPGGGAQWRPGPARTKTALDAAARSAVVGLPVAKGPPLSKGPSFPKGLPLTKGPPVS